MYVLKNTITYRSLRYGKTIVVPIGYPSDGATGAIDINSRAWWVHDYLCDTGKFSDGSPCNNLQASTIISDILKAEGRWFRARTWFVATYLFGGGRARHNGMY